MNDLIFRGRHRDGEVQMANFDSYQDDLAFGASLDQLETAAGIKGRANIETWFCAEIPRLPSSQLCVDVDMTTNQTNWSLVEVEVALEKFPRTNLWIECGLTEKIEGEFNLSQKKVPKVRWKCGVNAGQNCKKVVLEHANSTFTLVLVMHVQWDKLKFCVPLEGDCLLVCHAGLVVENLEVHQETPCCGHVIMAIGCNLMAVTFGLER
jgi:hypothetical protein